MCLCEPAESSVWVYLLAVDLAEFLLLCRSGMITKRLEGKSSLGYRARGPVAP